MAKVVSTGGWMGKLAGALLLVLAAAYVAKTVYAWLLPMVPGLLAGVGLVLLLATVARIRRP